MKTIAMKCWDEEQNVRMLASAIVDKLIDLLGDEKEFKKRKKQNKSKISKIKLNFQKKNEEKTNEEENSLVYISQLIPEFHFEATKAKISIKKEKEFLILKGEKKFEIIDLKTTKLVNSNLLLNSNVDLIEIVDKNIWCASKNENLIRVFNFKDLKKLKLSKTLKTPKNVFLLYKLYESAGKKKKII